MKQINTLKAKLVNLWASLEGPRESKLPAASVLEMISIIANIISCENDYLKAHEYDEATALFESKQDAITIMEQLSTQAQEYGVAGSHDEKEALRTAETRFHEVLTENRTLLKDAMDVQSEVMKILIEGAVEVSQHGYDRSGQAGFDSTKTTLSLDSKA